jgi:hypothetical protein
VDESIDRTALMHDQLPDVDKLTSKFSDDMYSQKHLVGYAENQLHKTIRKSRDPSFRIRTEGGSTYLVLDSGCPRLLFRETNPGGFGKENT